MNNFRARVFFIICLIILLPYAVFAQQCIECHKKLQPNIVSDWENSKHSKNNVSCDTCHGDKHKSAQDVANVKSQTPDVCASCHELQVHQFKKGKHAYAWAAQWAMPTAHWQPMTLMEGKKGCGGCHRIGLKSEEEIKGLKEIGGFGIASCDVCHTRHTFSVKEAMQPQACQTCHMGIDHPQWEMYSSSKHGVRFLLKQNGILPESVAAPTCQMCHMQDGNHAVRTAWGFLAVRLPMPEDKEWASDRTTILKGLGVLDPNGNPTARLAIVKSADVVRLTQEDWQHERDRMINVCTKCHSSRFATAELEKGDKMIREADRLMAKALRIVTDLYKDGILKKPLKYIHASPDLLTFHDAPTVIEQKLFIMFLKHRMRTFQGTFHANPDYALWYGWSEMQRDLTEIKEVAEDMREKAKK
ncbi:MAG: cytochrome C [Nitrospirae bacterium]|nr:cytochrome C [Nitrospirota bacterium]